MADQPGYMIEGRFYPMVTQYKHGDPILIHEVTGLTWEEFADLLAEAGEEGARPNPIVNTALIAVAVQRKYPTWSRRRVGDYINNLDLGAEEIVGIVAPEGDDAPIPPAESGENSSTSDDKSKRSPASPSSPSPTSSGDPGSATTTPELLPTG